jgi:hypothetical protein
MILDKREMIIIFDWSKQVSHHSTVHASLTAGSFDTVQCTEPYSNRKLRIKITTMSDLATIRRQLKIKTGVVNR